MTVPQNPNLPVGGPELNLLIDFDAGMYRLTKDGFDARTEDPDTHPDRFHLTEGTLSADIVRGAGSFIPDNVDINDIDLGLTLTRGDIIVFYYKVGTRYYYIPSTKGKYNSLATYSTDLEHFYVSSRILNPSGPGVIVTDLELKLRFRNAFDTEFSADWDRDGGFYQLDWQSHPVNWIVLTTDDVQATPAQSTEGRFKLRSEADGGGMFLAQAGRNITDPDPENYIIHPDKVTPQFMAVFDVNIAAGSDTLLPLPANAGQPMPLIFQASASGGDYLAPYVRPGFSVAAAQFEYEPGGVRFYNSGGSGNDRFSIGFLNTRIDT